MDPFLKGLEQEFRTGKMHGHGHDNDREHYTGLPAIVNDIDIIIKYIRNFTIPVNFFDFQKERDLPSVWTTESNENFDNLRQILDASLKLTELVSLFCEKNRVLVNDLYVFFCINNNVPIISLPKFKQFNYKQIPENIIFQCKYLFEVLLWIKSSLSNEKMISLCGHIPIGLKMKMKIEVPSAFKIPITSASAFKIPITSANASPSAIASPNAIAATSAIEALVDAVASPSAIAAPSGIAAPSAIAAPSGIASTSAIANADDTVSGIFIYDHYVEPEPKNSVLYSRIKEIRDLRDKIWIHTSIIVSLTTIYYYKNSSFIKDLKIEKDKALEFESTQKHKQVQTQDEDQVVQSAKRIKT